MIQIIKAENYLTKLLGLIVYNDLDTDQLMFLKNCGSIHTCFMRFNIDIIMVDNNQKIIKLIKNLKPWRFIFGSFNVKHIYEAKVGFVDNYNLKTDDNLNTIIKGVMY